MTAIAMAIGFVALVVTLATTWVTDVKVWQIARDSLRSYRRLDSDRRRQILLRLGVTYGLLAIYFALLLIAPFGVRRTLLYFVVAPVVVLLPLALIAVGVRGYSATKR